MIAETTARPADHYCGVCRYALERFRTIGEPDRFEHTYSAENFRGPRHSPVPVPLAELTTVHMVCDICSAPEPAYVFRFVNVRFRSQRGMEDLGDWWAICGRCAPLVERRSVPRLLARAALPFQAKGQPTDHLPFVLGPLYKQLLGSPFERLPAREVRW